MGTWGPLKYQQGGTSVMPGHGALILGHPLARFSTRLCGSGTRKDSGVSDVFCISSLVRA